MNWAKFAFLMAVEVLFLGIFVLSVADKERGAAFSALLSVALLSACMVMEVSGQWN